MLCDSSGNVSCQAESRQLRCVLERTQVYWHTAIHLNEVLCKHTPNYSMLSVFSVDVSDVSFNLCLSTLSVKAK